MTKKKNNLQKNNINKNLKVKSLFKEQLNKIKQKYYKYKKDFT